MMCRIGVETVSIIAAFEADSRSPALGIELPETGRFRALRLTTKALFMSSQRHVPGLAMFATGCATLLTGAAAGALRVRRVCMIIDSPLHQKKNHGSCCRHATTSSTSGNSNCSRRTCGWQMSELNIMWTSTKNTSCSLDHTA